VSKSSTEAEYRCLALVTAEVYWLRMLLHELQVSLASTPVAWCDNINALALTSNLIFHARSKHIKVNYHFVREKVAKKDIIPQYIPTSLQPADIFTKGHTADRFCFLQDKLSVTDLLPVYRGMIRIKLNIMIRIKLSMIRINLNMLSLPKDTEI